MPTYEFRCPEGHEFEKFYRTISGAEAQAACPHCGKISERFMSATNFAFKGSGFYLTDYGKNAHREKGTPTPASAASGEGSAGDGAKSDGAKSNGAKGDGAKSEGSKGEGSKSEGGKSEGGKSEGGKSDSSGSSSGGGSESAKPAPAPAAKPAPAPPKKSTGE